MDLRSSWDIATQPSGDFFVMLCHVMLSQPRRVTPLLTFFIAQRKLALACEDWKVVRQKHEHLN